IVQLYQPLPIVDRLPRDLPDRIGAEHALECGASSLQAFQQAYRLRVPEGDTGILPDDVRAEGFARVDVRVNDSVAVDQQQRQRELLDQVSNSVAAQSKVVARRSRLWWFRS